MTNAHLEGLQVVAFDGSAPLECGRTVPVVHDTRDDSYFALRDEQSATKGSRYSRGEVDHHATEGRLTLLPHPVPAYELGYVVYLEPACFEIPGFTTVVDDTCASIEWLDIVPEARRALRVAYLPRIEADGVLNGLARCAREEGDRLLATSDHANFADVDRLVDIGLAAANAPNLRKELHVRSALVQILQGNRDPVGEIFEYFVAPEFPGWTWDEFLTAVSRIQDVLRLGASATRRTDFTSTSAVVIKRVVADLARRMTRSAHPVVLKETELAMFKGSPSWNEFEPKLFKAGRLDCRAMFGLQQQLVNRKDSLGDLARELAHAQGQDTR